MLAWHVDLSEGHSRESGNPGNRARRRVWTPAYAGVTLYIVGLISFLVDALRSFTLPPTNVMR